MRRLQLALALAVFLALLTLFMISWGALVKSTGSSLGCPDWPLCYGQIIPDASHLSPEQARQLFWEYGHRLIGIALGLCCIALAGLLWKASGLRRHGLALLGLIVIQGLMGGATVLYAEKHGTTSPHMSTFHLGTSMLVLLYPIWIAGAIRRALHGPASAPVWPGDAARRAVAINVLALCALYVQIVLGAAVRHSGATFAAAWGPSAALLGIDPQTRAIVLFSSDPFLMLNLVHRYVAVGVALLIVLTAVVTWRRLGALGGERLKMLIWLPTLAVLFQVFVGVGMIAMDFALFMRTLHLVVAALALIAQFLLVAAICRSARQ
jgi:heme A synthase